MIRSVIRRFLPEVQRFHKFSAQQWKAINSILLCRTPALGGRLLSCDNCGEEVEVHHSCRNRNCPICQFDASRRWIAKQRANLLPVSYFHVVFTLPEELNLVFKYNRRLLYDLFFKTGAEVLQGFFADPNHVGAKGGFFGVLHTWGQLLQFHPHIHWVVPNGGIDERGAWVKPKRPDGDRFLFPVRAVSKAFRGAFLSKLEKLYRKGKLRFPDLQSECSFRDQLNMAAAKEWNVFAKRPFAGPMQVLDYLSRYTHRIAIHPRRILEVTAGKVIFRYKDYRDGGRSKTSEMDGDVFLRRFVQHVLPKRFRKIRQYGWMRGAEIKGRREGLLARFERQTEFAVALARLLTEIASGGEEPARCACRKCNSGILEFVRELLPMRKDPHAAFG